MARETINAERIDVSMLRIFTIAIKYPSSTVYSKRMSSTTASRITEKLSAAFSPEILEVTNESSRHNVPSGSETHFKVLVVSTQFENKSLIQRHRLINHTLADELSTTVHALSIQAVTPSQYKDKPDIHETPNCMGGGGK